MTDKRTLGLYLHVPFCVSKCRYCDFYSQAGSARQMDAYVQVLGREMEHFAAPCREYVTDTVYLGGGTPSCLGAARLTKLLGQVRACFMLAPDAEITVECNPESTGDEVLAALRDAGVNRLSLGVQSAHEDELQMLGRVHTFPQACDAVQRAKKHGFDNISLDLMYGLPGQTQQTFLDSVRRVLALSPQHLSCYGLKLEPNTPMGRENPRLPDDDAQAETYLALCAQLCGQGFEHYEISNFARAGYRSRHNSKYWDLSPYLGLGPGAHSYFAGKRFYYPRDLTAFLEGDAPLRTEEVVSGFQGVSEYLMLRLRTADGVSAQEIEERFAVSAAPYEDALRALSRQGLAACDAAHWHLTEQGFLVSNAAICFVTGSDENTNN